MSEDNPLKKIGSAIDAARQKLGRENLARAKSLAESREVFPFSSISPRAYERLKAESNEFPGLATPIDELIERFRKHGMRIATNVAENPGNLEIYLLPGDSDNIEDDGLPLKHLQENEEMDVRLKELIASSTMPGKM